MSNPIASTRARSKWLWLVGAAFAAEAGAAVVTVAPSNQGSWALYSTDSSGALNTGSATAQFVNGAGTPPLGTGSAQLMTAAGAGDGSAQIRNSGWAGTRLDALTSLSYSTYVTAWNGQQLPYLTLWLDTNNDGSVDDRLFFEPAYSSAAAGNSNANPQPDAVLNQWQTWNALGGMWYSEDGIGGPGDEAVTLATYLSARSNATIVNTASGFGGIRLASGFGSDTDNFNAYVDNFTIGTAAGTTTYNFEASAGATVPEPATLALVALSLAGIALTRQRSSRGVAHCRRDISSRGAEPATGLAC